MGGNVGFSSAPRLQIPRKIILERGLQSAGQAPLDSFPRVSLMAGEAEAAVC